MKQVTGHFSWSALTRKQALAWAESKKFDADKI
jgi:hypothetical protein